MAKNSTRTRRRRRTKKPVAKVEYSKKNLIIIIIILSIFLTLLTNALIYAVVSSKNIASLIGMIIFEILSIGLLIYFILKLQNK